MIEFKSIRTNATRQMATQLLDEAAQSEFATYGSATHVCEIGQETILLFPEHDGERLALVFTDPAKFIERDEDFWPTEWSIPVEGFSHGQGNPDLQTIRVRRTHLSAIDPDTLESWLTSQTEESLDEFLASVLKGLSASDRLKLWAVMDDQIDNFYDMLEKRVAMDYPSHFLARCRLCGGPVVDQMCVQIDH